MAREFPRRFTFDLPLLRPAFAFISRRRCRSATRRCRRSTVSTDGIVCRVAPFSSQAEQPTVVASIAFDESIVLPTAQHRGTFFAFCFVTHRSQDLGASRHEAARKPAVVEVGQNRAERWEDETGTAAAVLSLPQAMHQGTIEAATTGFPRVWTAHLLGRSHSGPSFIRWWRPPAIGRANIRLSNDAWISSAQSLCW